VDPVIEVEGLTKHYGRLVAVDHISFLVERGELFGFLGPNGAGKTTTIRMLTGVTRPTAGTARIRGLDIRKRSVDARRGLGIVPELANIYVDLSVWQNLMLAGELYHMPGQKRREKGAELLELFGLSDRRNTKGRELSRGLRQRLLICMALIMGPDILFLDEPTWGLDVESAHLIRRLVADIHRKGVTVFLTTHNMDEAETLCTRVAIIDHGRIAAIDTPEALQSRVNASQSVEVSFKEDRFTRDQLASIPHVTEVIAQANLFKLYTDRPGAVAQELARRASRANVELQTIRTCQPTLEEVYLEIVHGKPGARPPSMPGTPPPTMPSEEERARRRQQMQRRRQKFL